MLSRFFRKEDSISLESMKSSLVDLTTVNLMIADLDGKIIYLNEAVKDMLSAREAELKNALPGFSVNSILGGSFDRYHKNPSHQKSLLADERNLPYTSDISIADLHFRLNAFALKDDSGKHIANAVQWTDITEQKIKDLEIGRLTSTVKNATVNIMMCDNNFNITYMNPSLVKTLKRRELQIKETFSHFEVDKLIGRNIDSFHQNPAHQRRILMDESNLPFKSDITVSGIRFRLTAFSLMDSNGERIGNCVQWEDLMSDKEFANFAGQIEAIHKSSAVIEFSLDGKILTANENFLDVMKYSLDEIKGKHHKMFVTSDEVNSREYKEHWDSLARGEFASGEYLRVAKDGSEVWIQASYNPIFDMYGKPFKVVKYATDITLKKKAISTISESLSALAKGDLTKYITQHVDVDFLPLKNSMNTTMEQLNELVESIIEASSQVSASAREIAMGNADLSQRTEQQASSLEETSSSMEEFTGAVKLNAENAKNAASLALNAKTLAEKGGAVVNRAVTAMKEIEASSKKIADIIGVIDEIAFQTNLLALNASVEAARAGEQGRGFAVVASEVRNLAQRSANAAKEIKDLIQDSVTKVNSGTKLVNDSGSTLEEIVGSVVNVSTIISDIDGASEEQILGISQVNQAVGQMDEMTQQNAALVEEAAASAESLEEQAIALLNMMKSFKTKRGDKDKSGSAIRSPIRKQQKTSSLSNWKDDDDEWKEF